MIFITGKRYRHETSRDIHYLCVGHTEDSVLLLPYHKKWNEIYETTKLQTSRINEGWIEFRDVENV